MIFAPPLNKMTCIEDFRQVAKHRVPHMFYDYADSGSWTESTYRNNEKALADIKFRQRVAVDMSNRSTKTQMIGQDVAMPMGIGPVGLLGMQHADGEILAAQAAEKFGIPFTLSTMSVCSIEEVAKHTTSPFWFQLYVMKDQDFLHGVIDRAKAANCSALMITLDLQMLGQRHKDIKNGLSTPPDPTIRNILNLATKPYWCWHMLQTKNRSFGNIVGHAKNVSNLRSLSSWTAEQFDPSLSWDDVARIKDRWGGKVIIKGIMEPEDAELAVKSGADAMIVSNHGGRQLDGAPPTIDKLPQIVEAVGSNIDVWMDSGIRSGQDILKAWALGARGTMSGRAMLYALAAYGREGVEKALELMHKELSVTMAFCGHTDINTVDKSILQPGTYPTTDLYTENPVGSKHSARSI